MSDVASNNKRILKNSLMLYIRMFVVMLVSLFTSRVTLKVLGVVDYGLYNVVGGTISAMCIINNAMSVSVHRYLTFALGKGEKKHLSETFSMCVLIYVILSLLTLLLAETLGLWFFHTQLNIPIERMEACEIVYQVSVVVCVMSLFQTPFMAVILSHESMGAYAYISIVEVMLKLASVYSLTIITFDHLSTYALLYMMTQVIVTGCYITYAYRKFEETHYKFYWDRPFFKELICYSGWNLFGSMSGVAKDQGLNILLNIFFNSTVNAARAIAYQVNYAVSQFFTNFYTAVRPQIVKYYAKGEMEELQNLIFRSSKMSFFLIMTVSMPVAIETPYIISLWLGQLPEYVVPFIRMVVCITAVDCMSAPLMSSAQATGKIRLYQFSVGLMNTMTLPLSYVALKMGGEPITVFRISLFLTMISFFMRIWIIKRLIESFPVLKYIKDTFIHCFLVCAIALIAPLSIHYLLTNCLLSTITVCAVSLVSCVVFVYLIGLESSERLFVLNIIKNKIHK